MKKQSRLTACPDEWRSYAASYR